MSFAISRYAKPGGTSAAPWTPLSLLRTVEDLFGLTPLAGAAQAKSLVGPVLRGV